MSFSPPSRSDTLNSQYSTRSIQSARSMSSIQSTQSTTSYRSLEYYTPPKAYIPPRHLRDPSSALVAPSNKASHSLVKLVEDRNEFGTEDMAFNTLNGLAGRFKGGNTSETILMTEGTTQRGGNINHPWWNAKHWGKKGWLITAGVVAAIIIIVAVSVTETEKANAYPDYSKLTYTLAENCMCISSSFRVFANRNQIPGQISLTTSIIIPDMILPLASSTTSQPLPPRP